MSVDSDSFLALCKKLREMGAVKVEGFGFCAIFPVSSPATPPRAPSARGASRKAGDPANLSDEQLREARRAIELGQV